MAALHTGDPSSHRMNFSHLFAAYIHLFVALKKASFVKQIALSFIPGLA
jgi:hypothetical protein